MNALRQGAGAAWTSRAVIAEAASAAPVDFRNVLRSIGFIEGSRIRRVARRGWLTAIASAPQSGYGHRPG